MKYNGKYAIYLLNNRSWKELLDFNDIQSLESMWKSSKEEVLRDSFHPRRGDSVVPISEIIKKTKSIKPEKEEIKKAYRPGNIIVNSGAGYIILKFAKHQYKMVPLNSLRFDLSTAGGKMYSSKKELRESLDNGYSPEDELVKLAKVDL